LARRVSPARDHMLTRLASTRCSVSRPFHARRCSLASCVLPPLSCCSSAPISGMVSVAPEWNGST
jgi:hypothetical protein